MRQGARAPASMPSFGQGIVPGPLGSAHRMLAPCQAIRCADGYTLGSPITMSQPRR